MAGPYKTGGDWQPGMPKPGDPNWHGPMAAPMGNPAVAPPAAAPAQAAPAVASEGPMDLLGGIGGMGDEIGKFLEGLFGQAFGGTPSYPGYKWDSLNGWVPDGTGGKPAAPASPAPVAPAAGGGPSPQNFKNYVGKQGL